jgi:hypothetical protein
MKTPGQPVIDEFVSLLERVVDNNHDDASDLASWVAALGTVQARVQRKFNDAVIARNRKPTDEELRTAAARMYYDGGSVEIDAGAGAGASAQAKG